MVVKILPANIALKRAYDPPDEADGVRVLVDRLWPRGLTKAAAAIDQWAREIAPSTELRQWYHHDPARSDEFRARYRAELKDKGAEIEALRQLAAAGPITLIYAARGSADVNATVLRDVLLGVGARPRRKSPDKPQAKAPDKPRHKPRRR